MAYTERLNEQLALASCLDPEAYTTAATITLSGADSVDMRYAHRAMFVLLVGTVAANTTVDFSVFSATGSTTGTAATAITAITQVTATTDSDDQMIIEIEGQDLADGYRYLIPVITIGGTGGTVDLAMAAFADTSRYKPASENIPDLTSVVEIVNG